MRPSPHIFYCKRCILLYRSIILSLGSRPLVPMISLEKHTASVYFLYVHVALVLHTSFLFLQPTSSRLSRLMSRGWHTCGTKRIFYKKDLQVIITSKYMYPLYHPLRHPYFYSRRTVLLYLGTQKSKRYLRIEKEKKGAAQYRGGRLGLVTHVAARRSIGNDPQRLFDSTGGLLLSTCVVAPATPRGFCSNLRNLYAIV